MESGTSIYFRDPDGARIELLADSMTPHQAAIGTPSVIRNPSNGPMKLCEKNTM